MKCPICQKPVNPNDSNAPFCSDRCRLIDLGNWAAGKYVISTPSNPKGPMNSKGDESDEDES